MLLLVSGASGVGKSTARLGAAPLLASTVEPIELWHLGSIPPAPTITWRQEMVELAVQRAIALDAQGRHLRLAGDPVGAAAQTSRTRGPAGSPSRLRTVDACACR